MQALPEPAGHFPISTISDEAAIGQAGSTWRRKTALGHFKHVEGGDEAIRNLQKPHARNHIEAQPAMGRRCVLYAGPRVVRSAACV